MIKKFNEIVNESVKDDNYTLGEYEFWADKQYGDDRNSHNEYYIIYGDYEGHLIIEDKPRGRSESFKQLEGIEWDDETPEDWEEVEDFVDKNLYDIMKNAPVI